MVADLAALRIRVDALLDDGGIPYGERRLWSEFYAGLGQEATVLDLHRLIGHLEGLRAAVSPVTSEGH